jgi:Tfp pilus assembly protein PilN
MKKFAKSLATVAVLAVVTLGASACNTTDEQARQQAAAALQAAQSAQASAQQAAASAQAAAASAQAAADKVERIFNTSLRK